MTKMALRQTQLRFMGNPFLGAPPKHPFFNAHITSLPIKRRPPHIFTRVGLSCVSTSAADFKDHPNKDGNEAAALPRPAEIPWRKELCNSVLLIGIVGAPVEIKHLASGKFLAWTRLAVWKSPTDTSWISLTFWDEMAQIAFQHVQKGNQIFVSGRLVTDTIESDDGKMQTYYKVIVQQLNFIERSSPVTAPFGRDSNNMLTGRKVGNGVGSNMGSVEELWQAFFANPMEWWDNRTNKRNPRAPDFKHKDTGEALWIEGRYNPSWVKSQLARLDEKMGSFQSQDMRWPVSSMAADDLMPF